MQLSDCKLKRVGRRSIRSSIELMDELISEEYDFLVIEPDFGYSSRSCTVTYSNGSLELISKFRIENPQNLSAEELERCIAECGMSETSEQISDFAIVVSRTVNDELDICGSLTMTELRKGDWGWSSRSLIPLGSDGFYDYDDKLIEERFQKGNTPKNLFQSLKEFQYDHENEKLEEGEIYELKHPVVLKAQTSSDREYYCWGGNKYGDTHSFYITGVVKSSWYSPIVR